MRFGFIGRSQGDNGVPDRFTLDRPRARRPAVTSLTDRITPPEAVVGRREAEPSTVVSRQMTPATRSPATTMATAMRYHPKTPRPRRLR